MCSSGRGALLVGASFCKSWSGNNNDDNDDDDFVEGDDGVDVGGDS